MDVSIVYVNWNSTEYLCDSISSVYEHTADLKFEIIVVDNASPADDVDVVKHRFRDVVVLKSDQNLGFAGANNLGFRKSSGRYILFLNPDTLLVNNAISLMLHQIEGARNFGIVGCKLLNSDQSVQTTCVRKFPTIWGTVFDVDYLKRHWPGSPLWSEPTLYSKTESLSKVQALSGACMLIERAVFERVGLFCEEYFMYAEDLDLCYKVAKAGYNNYYCSEGIIIHYGGKSSTSEWAVPVMWKANLQFYRKMHGKMGVLAFRIVLSLVAIVRFGLLSVLPSLAGRLSDSDGTLSTRAKWRLILRVLLTES